MKQFHTTSGRHDGSVRLPEDARNVPPLLGERTEVRAVQNPESILFYVLPHPGPLPTERENHWTVSGYSMRHGFVSTILPFD